MRGWLFVVCVSLGCGDNLLPGIEDYPEAQHAAYCEYLIRCGELPDVATCAQVIALQPLDPDLIAAVRAGKTRWDNQAAYDCIERIANRTCDRTSEASRDLGCEPIVSGMLDEGEECTRHSECISGECYVPMCADACCRGTCLGSTPLLPGNIGEPCFLTGCAEGWCDLDRCAPFRIEGEACERDHECAYDLACHWVGGWDGVCEELPGAGEPCVDRCREVGQVCTTDQRCESTRRPGELCGADRMCGDHLRCDADHRCVVPLRAVGEPCDPFERCTSPAAYCKYDNDRAISGTCAPREPDGGACSRDTDCQSGRCDALGACSSEPCI